MLVICVCIAVLAACDGDETFVNVNTESQTGESDTEVTESLTGESDGEDDGEGEPESKAEQTFGGLQELKPLN